MLDDQVLHDGQVARANGAGCVRRHLVCGDGGGTAWQDGCQGMGRVVVHHGAGDATAYELATNRVRLRRQAPMRPSPALLLRSCPFVGTASGPFFKGFRRYIVALCAGNCYALA